MVLDEIQPLLGNCSDSLRDVVEVALNTGMRQGEIFGLTWDRANFEQGILTLLDTKNNPRRDVPMNKTVRSTLEGMEEKGGLVFDRTNLRKSFEAAVKKSGIENFRSHDLRHTFASNLAMAGEDMNPIRELLGHKSSAMTIRYSHLSPKFKTRAVEVLDRLASQIPPRAESSSKVVSIRSENH